MAAEEGVGENFALTLGFAGDVSAQWFKLLSIPSVLGALTPAQMRRATPECGEHTEEVLTEFGYSTDNIAEFRRAGAI